jgi:hypothetical protein
MGNLQCSFNYGYQHSGKRYFPKDGLNEVCAVRKFKQLLTVIVVGKIKT